MTLRHPNQTYRRSLALLAVILIKVVFLPVMFAADDHQTLFQQGVNFYDEREFEAALETFLTIESDGVINHRLYHNIGNCYFRLDRLGKAILYYKRGLRVSPNDEQLPANLNYALSFTKDRQLNEQDNPLVLWVRSFVNSLTVNEWLITLFLSFLLVVFFINLIIIFYRNKDKTVPTFLMGFCVIIFLTISVITYYRWNAYNDTTEAVLISSSANGYSGPASDFTLLFSINEGMIFNTIDEQPEWSHIRLPNGINGWIRNDTFTKVFFR